MHGKYDSKSFAAVSVSIDDPKDEASMKAVREFLKSAKAKFQNFVVRDSDEKWQDKYRIEAVPLIIVFNPEGKVVDRFDSYEKVLPLVESLMKK
jgi:hypothetical protein